MASDLGRSTQHEPQQVRLASNRLRAARPTAAVALAAALLAPSVACGTPTEVDPEQERNIRPGQRPGGTPRDEEN